ncbi:MAG: 50S ribosomal protein L30 [Myxococcota bacterium]|jgi:large subunit ribosomal protein L30|nr:50S ribosomal protein L30 [Myxococcota bacterium]
MAAERYFEVTLKKSGIGRPGNQKATLTTLGLTRFGKKVFVQDNPAMRGMLYTVVHLVDVTPHEGAMPAKGAN